MLRILQPAIGRGEPSRRIGGSDAGRQTDAADRSQQKGANEWEVHEEQDAGSWSDESGGT